MLSARKKYLERCASLRLGLEDDGGSSEEDDESSITHVDSLEEDKRGAAPVLPNAQDNDVSSCVLASIEYNSSPPPTPSKVLSKSLSRLSSPSLFRRRQQRRSCKTTSPRSCLDFDRVAAALSTNDEETSSECYDDADPPEDYVKCSFLDETDLLNISLAKKEEEKEVSAATTISAAYRGYYARQSLLVYDIIRVVEYSMTPLRCRDVNASILIQRAYRGYREYIKYVVKQYASIRIQRAYCDYVARQSILRDAHVRDVNAATRIQRGWRKFWTLINVECATIILQSWFRKCVAQHKTRYLSIMVDAGCIMVEEKSSVLTIQKWWRDQLNEQRILNEAAIVMVSEVNYMHFNQVNHFLLNYTTFLYHACINLAILLPRLPRVCMVRHKTSLCHPNSGLY